MSGWKKICCAVDFSDASRFAMAQAAELASSAGGELAVIHVVDERRPHGGTLPLRSGPAPSLTAEAGRRLEEWRSAAEHMAGGPVSATLLAGAAVDEILHFARKGGYDVLVIGTPGALGCERIVYGSVAEAIIRRAPCCVVVARRRAAA